MYWHESFRPRRARWRCFRVGVLLLVITMLVGGLLVSDTYASEPNEPTIAAASQAGVDPVDLEGALLTVGEPDPVRYLRHAGQLPWPVEPTMRTVWDALAQCESGGNWSVNAYHDGGLQFLPSTWLAYGGGQYARFAWQATREQQIAIAVKVQAAAGWSQWPTCARRLRLR